MTRFTFRLLIILLLCGIAGLAWWKRDALYGQLEQKIASSPNSEFEPDLDTYLILSGDLQTPRQRLGQKLLKASSPIAQQTVLEETRALLENALPHLMRCWLGTPWDFHGSAHQPGSEQVACGYFVSSVLQDAGFNVEWGALAQQPSQGIIATFIPRDNMILKVDADYESFMDQVSESEPGIYLVGLDSHVGFLIVTEDNLRFIHSAGTPPHCVVDQSREDAGAIKRSRYRVIGNLTSNHAVLRSWLLNHKFATHRE